MEIILKAVSKKIGYTQVLDNINCLFLDGKIYGIVGYNGSGKTMLLRTLAGLVIPTSGTIDFDGKRLHRDISIPPSLGLIIEKPEFLSYMTGLENLKQLAAINKKVSDDTIKEYMRLFELDPESKQTMRRYSLGMKQKIGIIQALMENPDTLILDEPFNALDEKSVLLLRKLLCQRRDEGKLIIVTSHYKDDIEAICDEVIIMQDGTLKKPNDELEATPVNESELPGEESTSQNDILQIGIRKATAGVYDEEGLKFTWSVENIGDYSVSFDKNMIAQIVLNGEDYAFETEAVTLEPGEAYSVDISIPYPVARQNGTNNVKITATTGDTTATYKESFTH